MDNYNIVIEIGDEDNDDETEEEEEEEDNDSEEEEEEEVATVESRVSPGPVKGKFMSQDINENNKNGSNDNEEFDASGIDGLCCPICMDVWTNGGLHQICCLPCGHIFGMSCIKKWLQQRRSSGKCPQCNKRCTLKDIRVLYASRLCVADAALQKKVRSLEAKCASLEKKNVDCCKKEVRSQEREADLHLEVERLTKKAKCLEGLLEDERRESQRLLTANEDYQRRVISGNGMGNGSGGLVYSTIFTLQREFQVDGARCFDMDASGELMIVARAGMGGTNLLTKISLAAPDEREDIQLPGNTKAVMSLCVRPCSRLALLASLGRKLSVVSTESSNTVLTYDLPAPAWSCSWDIDSSYHVYTGLQNGTVLAFDIRQTRIPLESRTGLSGNPVHTVISVAPGPSLPSGTKALLTASQIGICEWNFGSGEERPYLIPETNNQGVCISLAHTGGDDFVASFRPKIEMPTAVGVSQSPPTPSTSCGTEGSHIFYKRTGMQSYLKTGSFLSQMDSIRLPRSTIVNKPYHSPMFVSANDVTAELVLYDMSKLVVAQRLKTFARPVRDVRCTHIWNTCVLGCVSGNVVQLFS
uniref:E3 ubiquitin-protein ligase RFWD3-like isoform X2 n=1 Tax=Erigeron canadensis TaxID=72917 RepID=UPI001CB91048|nr:E3 ubiquitin-protein ligase RFWD3-like isoform X2 [Erigeron canadensis]